jgi:hypothetical protein
VRKLDTSELRAESPFYKDLVMSLWSAEGDPRRDPMILATHKQKMNIQETETNA